MLDLSPPSLTPNLDLDPDLDPESDLAAPRATHKPPVNQNIKQEKTNTKK